MVTDINIASFIRASLVVVQVIRTLQSKTVTSLSRMILLSDVKSPDCVVMCVLSGTPVSPNTHVTDEPGLAYPVLHSNVYFPGLTMAIELFT